MSWDEVDMHLEACLTAYLASLVAVRETMRQSAIAAEQAQRATEAVSEARDIQLRMSRKRLLFQKGALGSPN